MARLVNGSRLPQPVAERQADRAALLAFNDQLAALSADLNALLTLLRRADTERTKGAQLTPARVANTSRARP